jgi:hypothetical protein
VAVFGLALTVLGGASGGIQSARSVGARPTSVTVAGNVRTLEQAGAEGANFMQAVHVLAPFVVRMAEGTLGLNVPVSVRNQVSPRYFNSIVTGLAVLNGKIRSGVLETSISGEILRPGLAASADSAATLLTQDGHTGVSTYWWGQTFCINHHDLNAQKTGVYFGAAAATMAAALGAAGAAGVGISWALFDYFDHGRGSCFWAPWTPPFWWTSQ